MGERAANHGLAELKRNARTILAHDAAMACVRVVAARTGAESAAPCLSFAENGMGTGTAARRVVI